jgi:CRISPR system Cascade subunit CasC
LLGSIGRKGAAAAKADDGEDGVEGDEEPAQEGAGTRTAHLLFLSRQEIEQVATFARDQKDKLGKVFKKRKPDAKAIEGLRKDLQKHLEDATAKNAVDVGLFGRFVTSDEFDTIDAALQVAHGLGTQRVEVEYDYFTAVDDLGDTSGAGHLGESEYASSVMYLYACCDLAQLATNLGARREGGRQVDDEARKLARKSMPALLRAIAEATPKGKKNGTAPHTPAEYVEVVVRRGAPLSLANAFLKPVDAHEEAGDVMAASIQRLEKHRDRIEEAYGRTSDVVARYVLRLRGDAQAGDVSTMSALTRQLTEKLETLPESSAR